MEILIAAMALNGPGGVQSYVLTIAPHLERLGHEVILYAPETGPMADLARERGLRVSAGEHQLPLECDAVLSNDGPTALAMAEHYPGAVRGIVVHSADLDVHLPPRHPGVVSFAVAMNGVVERRLAASASTIPVTRLRQPIDIAHLYPAAPLRERPTHVLLLGNWLRDPDALGRACERTGAVWRQVGSTAAAAADPFAAILESDVVIGQGRSALDGMACGRAVWIYGPAAGDGWVTADTYGPLEDDGFRGRATPAVIEAESFGQALVDYEPRMGQVNRQLATLNHSPYDHAVAVAGLLNAERSLAPPPAPLREMARLVRTQYDAQVRVAAIAGELSLMHERYRELASRVGELEAERPQLEAERAELGAERAQVQNERARLVEALEWHQARWQDLVATRRWQAARLAAWPFDRARQFRRHP